MRRTRLLGGVSLLLFSGLLLHCRTPVPAEETNRPPETDRSVTEMHRQVAALRTRFLQPALAAGIVHGGETRVVAVGTRTAGGADPVRIDDCFHIGSCAKSLTATVLALLAAAELVPLERTLGEAWPELAETMHPDYRAVTVRQLLRHEGGVPPHDRLGDSASAWMYELTGTPRQQRQAMARRLLAEKPAAAPGRWFLYSNAGYALAAAVAEQCLDQDFEFLMEEWLLNPLQMQRTGFGWPAPRETQPRGHFNAGGPAPEDFCLPPCLAPALDMHCSLEDLLRFAVAHLAVLQGRPSPLPASALTELYPQPRPGDLEGVGAYGMGFSLRLVDEEPVYWHDGSGSTFFARLSLFPQRDVAIVVFSNAGSGRLACEEVEVALLAESSP